MKSFPIEFPMGQGDLHQPRLRADFSAGDYAQHKRGEVGRAHESSIRSAEFKKLMVQKDAWYS